jgi:hypothetical protein
MTEAASALAAKAGVPQPYVARVESSATASLDVGGFVAHVAALDDLIRMKRAAGRPTDRVEVEVLLALRDEITEAS